MLTRIFSPARLAAKRDDGFTLLELLIVVIVIGILAAIALPVFLTQQAAAYDASAQSDVRNTVAQVVAWSALNKNTPELTAAGYEADGGKLVVSPHGHVGLTVAADGSYTVCGYNDKGSKYSSATKNWTFDSTTGKSAASTTECAGALSDDGTADSTTDNTGGSGTTPVAGAPASNTTTPQSDVKNADFAYTFEDAFTNSNDPLYRPSNYYYYHESDSEVRSTTMAADGTGSATGQTNDSGSLTLYPNSHTTAGTNYSVSMWICQTVVAGRIDETKNPYLDAFVQNDATKAVLATFKKTDTTYVNDGCTWQRFTAEYTQPDNNQVAVQIFSDSSNGYSYSKNTIRWYADDIAWKTMAAGTTPNPCFNGPTDDACTDGGLVQRPVDPVTGTAAATYTFETPSFVGSDPSWRPYNYNTNDQAAAGVAHSGNYALDMGGYNGYYLYPSTHIVPVEKYRVDAWVCTNITRNPYGQSAQIVLGLAAGSNGNGIAADTTLTDTGTTETGSAGTCQSSWHKYSATYEPETTGTRLYMLVNKPSTDMQLDVYVDDVTWTRIN